MEAILEFVKSIVIFTFLSAILEQLISESMIQKYVRFFTGILFCILLLQGVFTVFKKQDFFIDMEWLTQNYTQEDMDDMFFKQEEKREYKIKEEYEKQEKNKRQKHNNKPEESKQNVKTIEIPKIMIEGEEDGE